MIIRDFLVTDMRLGKFPDSVEFPSWNVNSKNEVCSKRADANLTMQRIKEVEMANSTDGFMTSRSITGRNESLDCDLLDAMVSSSLEKLVDRHVHFRQRVSVEEQIAEKDDRLCRGRQIAYMIYEHFCTTGAYEAVPGLSDLFKKRLQNDNV